MNVVHLNGFSIHKGFLGPNAQSLMVQEIRNLARAAPLFSPITPGGRKMGIRMTSAGKYGWFSDRNGYRYVTMHPQGTPWPEIPDCILGVWRALVSQDRMPDSCLVNYYGAATKMGLHQDKDESDFTWPVLSVSLGDTGIFRMGGTKRPDPTRTIPLESGDVVLIGGEARLAFHGIDRIRFGSSQLLPNGGRINLTLRVVD